MRPKSFATVLVKQMGLRSAALLGNLIFGFGGDLAAAKNASKELAELFSQIRSCNLL